MSKIWNWYIDMWEKMFDSILNLINQIVGLL